MEAIKLIFTPVIKVIYTKPTLSKPIEIELVRAVGEAARNNRRLDPKILALIRASK